MVHTLRLDNYTPIPRKLVLGTNSSFGTESIKIERGAGWDGLNLTATWHIPGREEPLRVALLDGDAMDVPPEVTKEAKDGVLVLAGLASGVQRASCNVEYLILEQAGVYGGADAEPTLELAAQVLEATMQAKANANKAQQAAENAAADAAKAGPYAKAALAAKEAAEAASDDAQAAARAAKASENAAKASENAAAASEDNARISAAHAEAQKTAAAKSAADADSTANSIKDSMTQIAANKEAVSQLKENLTKISSQKAYMDGVTNLFNWIRGSYTVVSNRLVFNADNKYAISTPIAVSVKNASYIKISDFETYKYSLAITYGTDNWFYLKATSNPFEIPKNVTGLVVSVGRRDNVIITDYDITSVDCTIISDSEFDHLVALTKLFSMPKTIKSVIDKTQTNTSADAFLLNENISMDTNTAKGLFSKKIGGIGSITFTDWLPAEQLSNTFNVQQDDDYIYKCMHFPHDGTYPNLQYQDPNIIDVEPLPFKLTIGAIYVNTDVAEEFNGLIRIIACNLFGYKKGYWYEIDNRNIKWAQIYSLPWGTSDGTNIPIIYQNGTALIDLTNKKLTKNNVLHFGTTHTYSTEFDYYIVKVTVRCSKDSCGLKVGVDSRDNISGSPTQIVESRTFALNANTTLTAFAHNIPDSVYSMAITNFDNYVRLKVSHYYCGRVQINGFIINLLKDKKSVTTIKDLDSGEEAKIIINDGSVDTSSNNLIAVTERYSRIEVTAKKDIYINIIVSDTDAIENYNFDLIN